MRRISAELCDPLELRTDSLVGVPGLLQAARAGKVTIGNALGSGLVESDAFLSFLPSLSRFFLDEELAIPSVATWWCGQTRERELRARAISTSLIVRRISSARNLFATDQGSLVTPRDVPRGAREVDSRDRAQAATTSSVRNPRRCRWRRVWSGASSLQRGADLVTRLRRGDGKRLPGDARRAHAYRGRLGSARAVARSRRREQGHVGAVGSARRAVQLARATPSEPALAPRRPRSAEPHGRQLVLARPLHRARRRRGAAAAQPRDPARRRDRVDSQPRVARARRRRC